MWRQRSSKWSFGGRQERAVKFRGLRGRTAREGRRARAPMRGHARAANFLMGRELFMAWRGRRKTRKGTNAFMEDIDDGLHGESAGEHIFPRPNAPRHTSAILPCDATSPFMGSKMQNCYKESLLSSEECSRLVSASPY